MVGLEEMKVTNVTFPGAGSFGSQLVVRPFIAAIGPNRCARSRVGTKPGILDGWDDWIAGTGGGEEEDGCEDLARISRMKCHLRRALKGLEVSMISPKETLPRSACGSQNSRTVRGTAIWAVAAAFRARGQRALLHRTGGGATRR
jgi:hypothetical protein